MTQHQGTPADDNIDEQAELLALTSQADVHELDEDLQAVRETTEGRLPDLASWSWSDIASA